ncbi:MAG: hypothetical protein KAR07_06115 [Spirochaetes bacterium]|nr:hypothetical protein [Spirochaetota bacterium]
MKKYISIALFFVLFLFNACKSKPTDPLKASREYFNREVNIYKTAISNIKKIKSSDDAVSVFDYFTSALEKSLKEKLELRKLFPKFKYNNHEIKKSMLEIAKLRKIFIEAVKKIKTKYKNNIDFKKGIKNLGHKRYYLN